MKILSLVLVAGLLGGCASSLSLRAPGLRGPASLKTTFECSALKMKSVKYRFTRFTLGIDDQGQAQFSAMGDGESDRRDLLGTAKLLANSSTSNASFEARESKLKMLALTWSGQGGVGRIETDEEVIPLDCHSESND